MKGEKYVATCYYRGNCACSNIGGNTLVERQIITMAVSRGNAMFVVNHLGINFLTAAQEKRQA